MILGVGWRTGYSTPIQDPRDHAMVNHIASTSEDTLD